MTGRVVSFPARKGTPPAAIAKMGITTLSDNLQPGETLSIGRSFINIFRSEIEARLIRDKLGERTR